MISAEEKSQFISGLEDTALVGTVPDAVVLLPPVEMRVKAQLRQKRLLISPNHGNWCLITNKQANLLQRLRRPLSWGELSANNEAEAQQYLADMWEQGFISINGRTAPLSRNGSTEETLEPKEPNFIALHMVQGCNFRCAYCYNESSGKGYLKPQVALSLLEKACRELKNTCINVDFLGGEPLLALDSIVDIMREARNLGKLYGKKFTFMMQTNGALLNDDAVRVLQEYEVGVGVSLDGPAEIHDSQRRTVRGGATHELVVRNMLEARRMGLDVNPLAVIWDPRRYAEILEYFVRELGVRTVRFNNFSLLGRARQSLAAEKFSPADYSQGFLQMADKALSLALELDSPLRIYDLCWFLRDLVSPKRPYMCRRSPCGLGESIVSYGPDGYLYACEEYEEKTRQKMCLGRPEDLDLGHLRQTSPFWKNYKPRTVTNVPRCSKCALRKFCGGGCAHKTLAFFDTWYREDPMCAYYERVLIGLMWRIGEDKRWLQYLA